MQRPHPRNGTRVCTRLDWGNGTRSEIDSVSAEKAGAPLEMLGGMGRAPVCVSEEWSASLHHTDEKRSICKVSGTVWKETRDDTGRNGQACHYTGAPAL